MRVDWPVALSMHVPLKKLSSKLRSIQLTLGLVSLSLLVGCHTADPAQKFISRMDCAPPEKRPKNWEQTRSLMIRPAPAVGQPAPNFSLPTRDGTETVNVNDYQAGRPLVLIFGSFT